MLELAVRLCAQAAEIAFQGPSKAGLVQKPDGSPMTQADRMVQDRILLSIAEAYPEHAVCAEETVREPASHAPLGAARYTWVVDPLDGTRNFVAGVPCVSTSISVLDHGMPVVAAVRVHELGRTYTATAGGGAARDGRRIRVGRPELYGDLLLGFASSKDRLTVGVVQRWAKLPGVVLRNTGSTAAHLAWVAEGALAAAFGKRVMLWDVAAGALLVTEAGGRMTDPRGEELLPFDLSGDLRGEVPYLAAAPSVYDRVLGTIGDV